MIHLQIDGIKAEKTEHVVCDYKNTTEWENVKEEDINEKKLTIVHKYMVSF